MDLATISQELNKRFLAPLPEFYKRRIVVWYKVKMYKKFGFNDMGESASEWGGEKWHEMDIRLNF